MPRETRLHANSPACHQTATFVRWAFSSHAKRLGRRQGAPRHCFKPFPAGAALGAGGIRCFICSSGSRQERWPSAQVRPPPPQNKLRDLRQVPAMSPSMQEVEAENRPNPSGQGPSHTRFHPDVKHASAQPTWDHFWGITMLFAKPCWRPAG